MKRWMKKFTAVVATAAMVCSMGMPAFAAEENTVDEETKEKIAQIYLLDQETVNAMSDEDILPYLDGIETAEFVSSEEKYYKEIEDKNGEMVLVEGSKSEYQKDLQSRASTSWLKMTSSLSSKDSRVGIASLRCEWLVRPTLCQTDVLGLNVKQGSIAQNSQLGTYTTYFNDGTSSVTRYLSSAFDVTNEGALVKVKLDPGYNKLVTKHVMTASTSFYKELNSEQLVTSYLHQKVSIGFSPSFSFDAGGKLSLGGGLNLFTYFDDAYDNASISWI